MVRALRSHRRGRRFKSYIVHHLNNMINLEEQIKLLVEMQGLDTQIFKLEGELTAIPLEIKKMEEDFKEKTANLKKLEEGLKALQVKRKEREGDLESKEGTIKKYQIQLYQLKTNKEYATMQEEIGRVKADNSVIEEEIIRLLDQIDAENRMIQKEKEFLKAEEIKLSAEKKDREDKSKRIETELKDRNLQREALAVKVDKMILVKYERIINSKEGLAVVPVRTDACQGCFRIMPPQVINEIKMKTDLIFCDNCARILYIEE